MYIVKYIVCSFICIFVEIHKHINTHTLMCVRVASVRQIVFVLYLCAYVHNSQKTRCIQSLHHEQTANNGV